jgi:hypothetical protein
MGSLVSWFSMPWDHEPDRLQVQSGAFDLGREAATVGLPGRFMERGGGAGMLCLQRTCTKVAVCIIFAGGKTLVTPNWLL